MSVTLSEIIKIMEALAPPHLAESWDNTGLLLGDPGGKADRILLTLDVSLAVAMEARQMNAGLIISHHPLFIKPLKNVRFDRPLGKLIEFLVKNDIAVYSAHTNLDIAAGGVNTVLAQRLGLANPEVLHSTGCERYVKLVVFVPPSHAALVREAVCGAGAGWIGNYSHCTFQSPGTGTFLPLPGTDPFIGKQGEVSSVDEVRLETIVPSGKVKAVVRAMLQSHPYEEVAYDLYPLENRGPSFGLGVVGNLPEPVSFETFAVRVKDALGLARVRAGGSMGDVVSRVAVCGGSGAGLFPEALAAGAEVLVTGDVKYHTARDMLAAGLKFIDAGHAGTERVVLPALQEYLAGQCAAMGIKVEIQLSGTAADPFTDI
ncbi:MAG: Nif3-like dinuclear metal center hexameric protein [Armatimonadetes bacterium]|nr:Nif3-like dinuclear metal center hexameric protein [Armatimonadota bacterium]